MTLHDSMLDRKGGLRYLHEQKEVYRRKEKCYRTTQVICIDDTEYIYFHRLYRSCTILPQANKSNWQHILRFFLSHNLNMVCCTTYNKLFIIALQHISCNFLIKVVNSKVLQIVM